MKELFNTIANDPAFLGTVSGLRGSGPSYLAARLADACRRSLALIVPNEEQAAILEQDLALFSPFPVYLYPGYDIPPYTPLSPDPATVARRLATLYQVFTTTSPSIVVIPAEALLRRVIPKDKLSRLAELVIAGEETDQAELIFRLTQAGYEHVSLVQNAGEFSHRGGILDIFPPYVNTSSAPGADPSWEQGPVRLDFFGDTVESIRMFDPISQRSLATIEELTILPVSDILYTEVSGNEKNSPVSRSRQYAENLQWNRYAAKELNERLVTGQRFPGIEFFLPLFHEQTSTPLDFLSPDTILVLLNPPEITESLDLAWERIRVNYEESLKSKTVALPPDELFLNGSSLLLEINKHPRLLIHDFPETGTADPEEPLSDSFCLTIPTSADHLFHLPFGTHTLLRQELELERRSRGLLAPLAGKIANWLDHGEQVLMTCRSKRHSAQIIEFLEQHQLTCTRVSCPITTKTFEQSAGSLLISDDPITRGFDFPEEGLHVLSEAELFGEKKLTKRRSGNLPTTESITFAELTSGDVVVHQTHGLGTYEGLVTMTINDVVGDYLQLTYLNGDKLYVPIDRLNIVHKYQGLSDQQPRLDKLGGTSWASAKEKVKEAVWKVAQELLDLYARRQLITGHCFSGPDQMYHELEESFPYDETPGQLKAINEVIDDLTSEKVMDRLVCGDVGYGKTEVAIRAAFKVLTDSRQVVILVPTTVLAEQHAATFRERLEGFPVRVESLNRFKSRAEQKATLKGLADGSVDLVIGTHRLLSKDIILKNLGLLIIDEEHRFGVKDKEKIKRMRTGVDVLTLTATPIPRTLQMSLLGIRDLSVISSPPRHRRSVKTFVAKLDDLVIKEAIIRELQRNGQVFVVHNRVNSIHEMAHRIQKLRPEARVAVAHGQMPGSVLEEIMVNFVNHQIDVLVCTTIIESGLDIPNANTIIITRADRLGLAEIYQLRGRVGRSTEQAYAYLLVPSLEGLSRDAQRRLRALMDYNELGGGFKLAMSDLQIRGGGNILGESQSGNIAAVGYDLYLELLQKTVDDLKQRAGDGEALTRADDVEPEINFKISAMIPAGYIRDTDQRYIAYRRITSCRTEDELDDIKEELRDRYGPLPEETAHLLVIISLKTELKHLAISKLDQGDNIIVLSFAEKTPLQPEKLLELIKTSPRVLRLTPDSRLVVTTKSKDPLSLLQETKKTLQALIRNAT
ncbi:MAG: transcription-repair coupling factor [Proteobacteria bacterium]|nr:transcription-repair coupling factor [Pseudomonadota bacterium]MBU1686795.1 transcription-repair coupling factor [Pseudomonadota bacterium]